MSAQIEVDYKKGAEIYRQGTPGDGVYMILDGSISLFREQGDDRFYLAELGPGEILGELSAIAQTTRSVSAYAASDCRTLFIPSDSFRRSFADPLVRHVVHTMAARLRSTLGDDNTATNIPIPTVTIPTMYGESQLVSQKLPHPIEIRSLPFLVGKLSGPDTQEPTITGSSLLLPLSDVPDLAASHFEYLKREGQILVRDLGSTAGTTVNGVHLSRYTETATAHLRPGANSVIAGGPDSPVRFTIIIPFNS